MAQTVIMDKTFVATEALQDFRLVKLTSSSGSAVEYADATDSAIVGSTLREAAITKDVAVALRGPYRTVKLEAGGTISVGATVYTANDGKIAASGTYSIGTALEAATSGAIIEVLLDAGTGSQPGYSAIANFDATYDIGVPLVLHKTVSNVTGGAATTTEWTAQRKLKIIDLHMYSRDTQAANVTVLNDSDAITAATAKGTTNDAKVEFTTVDDTYTTVASGDPIKVTMSADGVVDINIIAVPVA